MKRFFALALATVITQAQAAGPATANPYMPVAPVARSSQTVVPELRAGDGNLVDSSAAAPEPALKESGSASATLVANRGTEVLLKIADQDGNRSRWVAQGESFMLGGRELVVFIVGEGQSSRVTLRLPGTAKKPGKFVRDLGFNMRFEYRPTTGEKGNAAAAGGGASPQSNPR